MKDIKEIGIAILIGFVSSFFWTGLFNLQDLFIPYLAVGIIGVGIAKYIIWKQEQGE